jgi:hypothetical protein
MQKRLVVLVGGVQALYQTDAVEVGQLGLA